MMSGANSPFATLHFLLTMLVLPLAAGSIDVCSDACGHAGDGVCDDGGPGSMYMFCEPATDCTDCGIRTNTGCSVGCFDYMWNDRTCDEGCNTFSCGHNDCTELQIIDHCLQDVAPVMREREVAARLGAAAAATSTELQPVAAQVTLEPLSVQIDPDTRETFVDVTINMRLEWDDWRLFSDEMNPCCGVVPDMLSLTADEAASEEVVVTKARYANSFWMPKAIVHDAHHKSELLERTFALHEDHAWIGSPLVDMPAESWQPLPVPTTATAGTIAATTAAASSTPASESDGAEPEPEPEADSPTPPRQYAASVERQRLYVKQPDFNYFSYPFDTQHAKLQLTVAGTQLLGCDAANASLLLPQLDPLLSAGALSEQLLPKSSDWRLRSVGGVALRMQRPTDASGAPDASGCEISIEIKRNPTSFIAKELVPGMIVVLTGLLGCAPPSLFPAPTQPPGKPPRARAAGPADSSRWRTRARAQAVARPVAAAARDWPLLAAHRRDASGRAVLAPGDALAVHDVDRRVLTPADRRPHVWRPRDDVRGRARGPRKGAAWAWAWAWAWHGMRRTACGHWPACMHACVDPSRDPTRDPRRVACWQVRAPQGAHR